MIEDDKELDNVDWVVLVLLREERVLRVDKKQNKILNYIWEIGLDVVMIVEDDNLEVVDDKEDGEFVVEVVVELDDKSKKFKKIKKKTLL